MTKQKTAERIVAEAMVNAGAPLMHSRVEEAVVKALQDAHLLVSPPTGDERDKLHDLIDGALDNVPDGRCPGGFAADELIDCGARLAGRAPDAREHLHARCDCVPDLGPAHCHLCSGEDAVVKWEKCEAVREIADGPEPVDVVHATLALVEQQRISNLIALAGLEMNGPLRHLAIQPDGPYSVEVKPDIAAALGLTAEQEGGQA